MQLQANLRWHGQFGLMSINLAIIDLFFWDLSPIAYLLLGIVICADTYGFAWYLDVRQRRWERLELERIKRDGYL